MVHSNFDAKKLLLICLRISPQIFAIVPNFAFIISGTNNFALHCVNKHAWYRSLSLVRTLRLRSCQAWCASIIIATRVPRCHRFYPSRGVLTPGDGECQVTVTLSFSYSYWFHAQSETYYLF